MVKKAKKSLSLLVLHLSHTPCIAQSFELQYYIKKKLKIVSFISSVHESAVNSMKPTKPPPARPSQVDEALDAEAEGDKEPQMSHRQKYELLNQ